ncbi:hypothetical protein QEZ40_000418 [Streptomyces katrae]|uniref:Uncharacterized protein n=1 Tax=Streptomyces katrae TaxID=68223 RepID=A0ABT7GS10_9ACTN|nr:hypothetical protein [Streptomyces katrae]MDK9496079.1 hypothetical protein [Streptomyces katrae]
MTKKNKADRRTKGVKADPSAKAQAPNEQVEETRAGARITALDPAGPFFKGPNTR